MRVRIRRPGPRMAIALEAAALGGMLAVFDLALHVELHAWLETPRRLLRAALGLGVTYGVPLGLAGFLLGRRRLLLGLSVVAFATGQMLLDTYRSNVSGNLGPTLLWQGVLALVLTCTLLVLLPRWLPPAPKRLWVAAGVAGAAAGALLLVLVLPPAARAVPDPLPHAVTGTPANGRPNLLLVTLDTVRPDHLPAHGYAAIHTPAIDRLASEGVVFENAVSQAPLTPVSHASILTGLTPAAHGLRNFDRQNRLRESVVSLAEILSAQGYRTGAIVAAAVLDASFGLSSGFDSYRLVPQRGFYPFPRAERTLLATALAQARLVRDSAVYRPARPQVDDAVAWLERSRGTSFFLWLHLFDAHEPYDPRPQDVEGSGRVGLYDAELRRLDRNLGRLFRRLAELGLSERTLVVLASDHGDGLGDHGYYGHTARLFREQTRMVLILRWPGSLPAGTRVPWQVRSIDVLPTVLPLLGSPCPPVEGRDLRPWIAGEAAGHLPATSETLEPDDPAEQLMAMDDGRFKLIRTLTGRTWLFDRLRDPEEQVDLSEKVPSVRRRLARALDAHLAEAREAAGQQAAPQTIDPKLRERLESLGYLR